MKFFLLILLFMSIVFSCKVKKLDDNVIHAQDTIQFSYLYSEALKNKMLGYNKLAIDQFLNCLKINTASSASAYQLSILYLKENEIQNALKYADICLQRNNDNEWYLLNRANLAKITNEKDNYLYHYTRLVQLFPDNINYLYELAIIHYERKNYAESLKLINHIEEIIGIDESLSFLKNNIYFETKHYESIQAELLKLKVTFPDSIKYMDMLAEFYLNTNMPEKAFGLYNDILKKEKENFNAVIGMAFLFAKMKNYRNGYPYLLKALKSEESENSKKETIAALYLDSPSGTFSETEIDSIYSFLYESGNPSIEILNDYLEFLSINKRITRAETVSKMSVKTRPENYWAWDYLFNILLLQSRVDELNEYALKALDYFPNHATVYYYAGITYFFNKKFDIATRYFESGKNYIIDNTKLEQQFNLYLAESYHALGKHKKSDEYFDRYLMKDSTNAFLLNNYAYYLVLRNSDISKAEKLSRKSIEIDPFNPIFLDTYAWIMYYLKDYGKALNYIQRAYKYGGNKNSVVVEHYGDILSKLANFKEAVEKYEESFMLNRNNNNIELKIKEIRSKLKE